jgi:putative endonuclease
MFVVYILFSETIKKYYVGSCGDFERRFHEHNSGQSDFTRPGVPWKLVLTIELPTRSKATQLERKIKKRGIQRYLDEFYPSR